MSVKTNITLCGKVQLYKVNGRDYDDNCNRFKSVDKNLTFKFDSEHQGYVEYEYGDNNIMIRIYNNIDLQDEYIKLGELLECLEEIKNVALR